MSNPVVHFEIGCRDLGKTDGFYTSMFDWNTSDYGPLSRSIDTKTKEGIQGFITALGHEPHNYVMMYVTVDDVKASVEKAVQLGGTELVPPTEIPGIGTFAWIADPDGNQVGLWKPTAEE